MTLRNKKMSFKVECNFNTEYLAKQILRKMVALDKVQYRRVMLGKQYNQKCISEREWIKYLEENNKLKNDALQKRIEIYGLRALINRRYAKFLSREVQDKWTTSIYNKKNEKREVPKGTPLKSEN